MHHAQVLKKIFTKAAYAVKKLCPAIVGHFFLIGGYSIIFRRKGFPRLFFILLFLGKWVYFHLLHFIPKETQLPGIGTAPASTNVTLVILFPSINIFH